MISVITRRNLLIGAAATGLLTIDGRPALAARTISVSNAGELDRALANATGGTTIYLRDGTYSKSGSFTAGRGGVRIMAANKLRATMRTPIQVDADGVEISGLRFDNAGVRINRNNCRVSNCSFTGGNARISLTGASNAKIHNNSFTRWGARCIAFDPRVSGQGKAPHIYSNYFNDSPNVCIALGFQTRHQPLNVGAIVENNLFTNCRHDQVINTKSSGNTIRGNTMVNGGTFVNRFGMNNRWENNWLENCKGIWMSDKNCQAVGNNLVGGTSQIWILGGNVASERIRNQADGWVPASGARVANNSTSGVRVGVRWGNWTMRVTNTVITGHRGTVRREFEQNTQVASTNNSSAARTARKLSTSAVGA